MAHHRRIPLYRTAAAASLIMALTLLGLPPSARPDAVDEAMQAARLRNYSKAAKLLKPMAEQGDARAQYQLAGLYRSGRGVPVDLKEAFQWMQKAARQGHAKAQYNLGGMYENGWGVHADKKEALRWYGTAAAQDHARAKDRLDPGAGAKKPDPPENPDGGLPPPEEELRWAAAKGDLDAGLKLLQDGVGGNSPGPDGRTALIDAAAGGNILV